MDPDELGSFVSDNVHYVCTRRIESRLIKGLIFE
jgi:hypothetical protein